MQLRETKPTTRHTVGGGRRYLGLLRHQLLRKHLIPDTPSKRVHGERSGYSHISLIRSH